MVAILQRQGLRVYWYAITMHGQLDSTYWYDIMECQQSLMVTAPSSNQVWYKRK